MYHWAPVLSGACKCVPNWPPLRTYMVYWVQWEFDRWYQHCSRCAPIFVAFKRKVLTEIELHQFPPPFSLFRPAKIPSLNPSCIPTHLQVNSFFVLLLFVCVLTCTHTYTHNLLSPLNTTCCLFVVEHIVSVKITLYWILHQEAYPLFVAWQ